MGEDGKTIQQILKEADTHPEELVPIDKIEKELGIGFSTNDIIVRQLFNGASLYAYRDRPKGLQIERVILFIKDSGYLTAIGAFNAELAPNTDIFPDPAFGENSIQMFSVEDKSQKLSIGLPAKLQRELTINY